MSLGTAVRGCGNRVRGGIYAECGLSADGRPVEDFLVDPPAKVDAQALGLSDIGVKLVQTGGVWNVLDIVGQDSYANVADFVEEVRRFGVSRRLPKTLDFSKLTAQSRLILLHRRAYIDNFAEYNAIINDVGNPQASDGYECPKRLPRHRDSDGLPNEMCAGLWWHDVEGATWIPAILGEDPRRVVRMMPSFLYVAHQRPDTVHPTYSLAIFAAFPIHNLAVIRDPEGSSHDAALESASKAGLAVNLEAE